MDRLLMHRGICQFFFVPSVRPPVPLRYLSALQLQMLKRGDGQTKWHRECLALCYCVNGLFLLLTQIGCVCVLGTYLRLPHTHLKVRFLLFGQQPSSHRIFWAPESSIPFSPFDLQIQRLVPLCSATKRPPLHLWQIFNIQRPRRLSCIYSFLYCYYYYSHAAAAQPLCISDLCCL